MRPGVLTVKAYSYVRFSTPEQAKGDSRRRQTDLAARYAAENKLTLDTELKLEDLGVSAFRGSNELAALGGFKQAVADGIVPPGSVLLVESLDRISRKVARKAVRVLEEIVEAGVEVVTLNDRKRYTKESLDGFDFIMAVLILIRGNEESETKSKRLKAAWVGKRASGKLLTRVVPGWIRIVDGTPQLVPDRVAVVRRIFEMFVTGTGKWAIAKALNGEGVPTFGRAREWHQSYVQKVLRSPTVIGTMTPHTESHLDGKMTRTPTAAKVGYFPAAISTELWEQAQTLLSTARFKTTSAKVQNILAGLAKCPRCGGSMTRVWKGKRSAPKLVCAWAKVGGTCPYRSVSLADVTAALVRSAGNPFPSATAGLDTEIRDAEAALDATQEAIDNYAESIARTPSATLSKYLAGAEESAEKIKASLADLRAKAAQTDSLILQRRSARLKAALTAVPLDVAAANTALREVVSSVTVDYDRDALRMFWRHNGESEIAL
jgi:DNA invertase Pin-like site-specific DNA recombinase